LTTSIAISALGIVLTPSKVALFESASTRAGRKAAMNLLVKAATKSRAPIPSSDSTTVGSIFSPIPMKKKGTKKSS
jgi:hypothetical protein